MRVDVDQLIADTCGGRAEMQAFLAAHGFTPPSSEALRKMASRESIEAKWLIRLLICLQQAGEAIPVLSQYISGYDDV